MKTSWLNNALVLTMLFGLMGTSCVTVKHEPSGPQQTTASATTAPTAATQAKVQASYSQLPLHFEANQGQSDQQVKFLSRGNGYALFLTPTEAVLSLQKQKKKEAEKQESASLQPLTPDLQPPAVVRMQLAGANPKPQVEGLEELPGKINYFIGNDPAQWRTNVPTYAKIKYRDVYPGVDLVYYGNQRQLEFDFVVAPGVDPATITLSFQDQNGQLVPVRVDENDDLVVRLPGGEIRLRKPLVYQEVNGIKQEIAGHYAIFEPSDADSRIAKSELGKVSFQVASYDASKPLIIDPILEYSTYLGGSHRDEAEGIAVDKDGNAYITGWTFSSNFPTSANFPTTETSFQTNSGQIFIAKISTTGSTLIYSTYLGG